MNNSKNLSCINESNTWIFVLPAQGRQNNDDFDEKQVSLTWKVSNFTQTQIFIQLNFSYPW